MLPLWRPGESAQSLSLRSDRHIRGKPARGERWTTGDFIKACAETRDELEQWARQIAGGELHPCGLCRPDYARALAGVWAREGRRD